MRLRALFLCAALAAPVAVVACSSSSGTPGPTDAGACGGFASNIAACNDCLGVSCCTQGDTCHQNSECQALFQCIQGCDSGPCEVDCESAHPKGFDDLNALYDCINVSCPTQCGVVSPDGGGLPPFDAGACGGFNSPDATCNACFTSNCCAQGTACGNDLACSNLFSCLAGCTTQTCADNCNTMYAAGETNFNAFSACLGANCTSVCGGGDGGPTDAPLPSDAGMCGGYGSPNNPACNTCLDTSCCTQAAACGASGDCNNLFACVQACPHDPDAGPPCQNQCASQFPNAVATYNAFITCMNNDCTSACSSIPDAAGE